MSLVRMFRLAMLPSMLHAQQDLVELKFEPMGANGPGPQDLFNMLTGAADGQYSPNIGVPDDGPADLGRLFNSLLADAGTPRKQQQRRSSKGLGAGSIVDGMDRAGPEVWLEPMSLADPFNVPATAFSDLFPGPVAPPDATDMMVANMMQHISHVFKDSLVPTIRSLQKTEHDCAAEVRSMCNSTQQKPISHLHCLGQHSQSISDKCRARVGKSVPFLCHKAIDQSCDGLDRGILPCLADRLGELQGPCRDAVVATHGVIAKVNTQKASLLNPATGETLVHVPATSASATSKVASGNEVATTAKPVVQAVQREVKLDKILATAAPQSPQASVERPVTVKIAKQPAVPTQAAATVTTKQPPTFKDQQDGRHSWGSYMRGVIVLAVVGGFVFMFKRQGNSGAKPRCMAKGGPLMELNSQTADHIL